MENIQTKQYPCFKRWSRKNWSVFASLHRYVTIGVLSVGMSILLLATQGASAQTVDTTAVLKTLRIREVGVTGSQTAPARNAQSHTPLFDRKAQAPAPVQTLEAALRLAPSVDVRERGGKGTQADIFIRGGSFDQTMVLLNGIDFTDARTGHQSHALPVDLDCISAVELIDGVPGVGAYAGAVNIRTAPLRPTYLRLEAGAWQSMRLPTFTDLYYTSPAQINNLDLTPEHAVTYRLGVDYLKRSWNLSAQAYYRSGRDIIDWVWREDMGSKWHSEQTSSLDTFGIELAGGYTVSEGFLRRVTLSYGYITTDRNADVIAKSAMDFMRHKAALAVEVHFLRRMSLALTGSVYDRSGSYTHYPEPGNASLNEERDYKPYFLLDGRLQWEKGICRLYVDATNITDTRYCDIGGIRLPGFWCTGGVTLTIGK